VSEQCFTSPPKQYRLYGRWFFGGFSAQTNTDLVFDQLDHITYRQWLLGCLWMDGWTDCQCCI